MALLEFYPLQKRTVAPLADLSLSSAELRQKPDQTPKNRVSSRAANSAAKPDADLNAAQQLATTMELARQQLQQLLLQNNLACQLMSAQLAKTGSEDGDDNINYKTLTSLCNSIVQNNDPVQGNVPSSGEFRTASDTTIELLGSCHFYSAYLIQLTEPIISQKHPEPSSSAALYKKQVLKSRYQLQALREQMIVSNTGLVAFIAHKYKTTQLSFDDLMQEGMVGLIKAVDRFDPNRGICFSTYAVFWIKQAISRLIVKQDRVVRLPIALAEKASAVFEVMRNCYLEHNRWPSQAELEKECDLSVEEIKTVSSYFQATHSLDAAISEENDDLTLMDSLQQQQFSLPLSELIDNNLNLYIENVVASLPEKEATILNMRFGLKNHTEMTLQAIADQLQVTRERVRQIQNQALKKLKEQFGYDLVLFLEPNDS